MLLAAFCTVLCQKEEFIEIRDINPPPRGESTFVTFPSMSDKQVSLDPEMSSFISVESISEGNLTKENNSRWIGVYLAVKP